MLNIKTEKQLKELFKYKGKYIIYGLDHKEETEEINYQIGNKEMSEKEMIKTHFKIQSLLDRYGELMNEADYKSSEKMIYNLHSAYMNLSEIERYLIRERLLYNSPWKSVDSGYSGRQARKILNGAIEKIINSYNGIDIID